LSERATTRMNFVFAGAKRCVFEHCEVRGGGESGSVTIQTRRNSSMAQRSSCVARRCRTASEPLRSIRGTPMRSLVLSISLLLIACTGSNDPRDVAVVDSGPSCTIAGYGACAAGTSCVTAHCASGAAVSCACTADGRTLCTGGCFSSAVDSGAFGDAFDAIDEIGSFVSYTCTLPDGSGCNAGSTCRSASCERGASVACTCASDGTVNCDAACPACLTVGATCGPVSTGAVCCAGLVCTRTGAIATCQPPDAGSPCGTPSTHCCNGTSEVDPVCDGTNYSCPSGSTPSASSCVPGTDV
jgi:hypothetical protein